MALRHVPHRRREEVDAALDLHRLLLPAVVQGKAGLDLRRTLDEEAERATAAVAVLEPESLDVEHPLALHVQPLPGGGKQLDLRRALDHLAEQRRALDEMLEGPAGFSAGRAGRRSFRSCFAACLSCFATSGRAKKRLSVVCATS